MAISTNPKPTIYHNLTRIQALAFKFQNISSPLTLKYNIVWSVRDREVAFSASDRQCPNFASCVWRAVSSHPQEVLLAQFSLYVHQDGLKPHSFIHASIGSNHTYRIVRNSNLVCRGHLIKKNIIITS